MEVSLQNNERRKVKVIKRRSSSISERSALKQKARFLAKFSPFSASPKNLRKSIHLFRQHGKQSKQSRLKRKRKSENTSQSQDEPGTSGTLNVSSNIKSPDGKRIKLTKNIRTPKRIRQKRKVRVGKKMPIAMEEKKETDSTDNLIKMEDAHPNLNKNRESNTKNSAEVIVIDDEDDDGKESQTQLSNLNDSSVIFFEDKEPGGLNSELVPLYNDKNCRTAPNSSSTTEENDCVIVDNTDNSIPVIRLKDDQPSTGDDSIIFVSEERPNRTITQGQNLRNFTFSKSRELGFLPLSHPGRQECLFSLFQLKSDIVPAHLQLSARNEYNSNLYNPNKKEALKPGKRMVIIDGSNVAFSHGNSVHFSAEGIKISIEYFEKMGHEVKAVVPRYRLHKSTSDEILLKLLHTGKIVITPCKNLVVKCASSYDDRFILQLAVELDAVVISNDNYLDLRRESIVFHHILENRVVGYSWCSDLFILPKDPYGRDGPKLDDILNRK